MVLLFTTNQRVLVYPTKEDFHAESNNFQVGVRGRALMAGVSVHGSSGRPAE